LGRIDEGGVTSITADAVNDTLYTIRSDSVSEDLTISRTPETNPYAA
jgi:hypothetical protein